jgi:hypothetical protein
MQYDQSWMGYGTIGGLESGAISLIAAFVLYLICHLVGRRQGWAGGFVVFLALFIALVLTASGDAWDLLYFNYSPMQSLQILSAKLAEVHDPDNIGGRVFWEFVGAGVGVFIAWAIFNGDSRRRFFGDE